MTEVNTGINTNVGSRDSHAQDNRRSWTHTDFHLFELHKGTTTSFVILIAIVIVVTLAYCVCKKQQKKMKLKRQRPPVLYQGGPDPRVYLEMGLPPPPASMPDARCPMPLNHIYDRPADAGPETSSGRRETRTQHTQHYVPSSK